MERFYDGDQEKLFKDAHVINPFRKPSTVNKPKVCSLTHHKRPIHTSLYFIFLDKKIWNGRLRDMLFVISSKRKYLSTVVLFYILFTCTYIPFLYHTLLDSPAYSFYFRCAVFLFCIFFYQRHCPSIGGRGT